MVVGGGVSISVQDLPNFTAHPISGIAFSFRIWGILFSLMDFFRKADCLKYLEMEIAVILEMSSSELFSFEKLIFTGVFIIEPPSSSAPSWRQDSTKTRRMLSLGRIHILALWKRLDRCFNIQPHFLLLAPLPSLFLEHLSVCQKSNILAWFSMVLTFSLTFSFCF